VKDLSLERFNGNPGASDRGTGSNNLILKTRDLLCGYGSSFRVGPISIELERGEVLIVLGPNGAGKTTFLKTVLGLLKPLSGGIDLLTKKIGYVPQREAFPDFPLTVFEYVSLPLMIKEKGLSRKEVSIRVFELLSLVGLKEKANAKVVWLSGGQFRRLTIARSLVGNPDLILLDEPLTFLDLASQREVVEILGILKDRGVSQVVVTHDINPLFSVGDKALFVGNRVVFGKIDDVLREDLLEEVYGEKVIVIEHQGRKCLIHADHHRPHGNFSYFGRRFPDG